MNAARTPVPLRAGLSWLVLGLLFAAPLAPALHMAATAHHVCVEHGAIEHGEVHVARAVVGPALSAAAQAEHEHCDALAILAHAQVLSAPDAIALAVATATPTIDGASELVRSGPRLLLLAPKTSPPMTA